MHPAIAGIIAFFVGIGGAGVTLGGGGGDFGSTAATDDGCVQSGRARTCEIFASASVPRPMGEADVRAGVSAPVWREGFAWRVLFGESEAACTVAVVEATEDLYRQGFSCRGADVIAAQVSTWREGWIGEFSRALNGTTRDGEAVPWYDWPLTDGKQWTSEFFGTEVAFTAEYAPDVEGPNGPEPGYLIEVTPADDDEVVISYNYVPSIGWWSHLEFASGYYANVVAFDEEWEGTATSGASYALLAETGFAGAHTPLEAAATFDVPPDHEMVVLTYELSGLHYENVDVVSPSGRSMHERNHQRVAGSSWFYDYLDAEAGTWEIRLTGANFGSATFRAYGIDLTKWEL